MIPQSSESIPLLFCLFNALQKNRSVCLSLTEASCVFIRPADELSMPHKTFTQQDGGQHL